MRSLGLVPAVPLLAGVSIGMVTPIGLAPPRALLAVLCLAAIASFLLLAPSRRGRLPAGWGAGATTIALVLGFACAGAALAAHGRDAALRPALRNVLDARFGGFDVAEPGPGGDHDPLIVEATLVEDAAPADGFVSLRVRARAVVLDDVRHLVEGGVMASVGGAAAAGRVHEWRAGRRVRMAATFRRPARYLNEGIPDAERDLALDGTTLFASVKSGWLVEVIGKGSPVQEAAARARACVRLAVAAHVAPRDRVSAAILTAVLIGDRTGLPDDVRERLQAAGTYHVIAISGGNIAILTAATLLTLMAMGIRGRAAAAVTVVALVAYALIVTTGPSVWRATLVAGVYLTARMLDHRSPPWHATAVAAAVMATREPLDARDIGFVLTFGASAALLESARLARLRMPRHPVLSWAAASILASCAVELVLLPIAAQTFSRVTSAGLVLNLLAVPLMAVAQCAGTILVLCAGVDWIAAAAGMVAHLATAALVGSAGLIDLAPWLTTRVPPPGSALIAGYYAAGACVLLGRRGRGGSVRAGAAVVFVLLLTGIVTGAGQAVSRLRDREPPCGGRGGCADAVRLTMFDVGQSEAMLLESAGRSLLVDAGGAPFGSGFDIGTRVLAPALWARGLRSLDSFLFTHADPDHIGGARAVLRDFGPREMWEGVRVPAHRPTSELVADAANRGAVVRALRAGDEFAVGRARIRILHPPEPDWERQRVRNDDSVVIAVVVGDVAVLLTGDISQEVERTLVASLPPARLRVLKVAHHGSRSSTAQALLDAWRPQLALISAGRGNSFGHPAAEVVHRLESIGATVLRTDRHGQITIDTEGATLRVTTFTGTSGALLLR